LRSYAAAHGLAPKQLSEEARTWLSTYPWPGNVRELGHLMERVTLLSSDEVISGDALEELAGTRSPAAPASASAGLVADDSDAGRVRDALQRAGGEVVRAPRPLGPRRQPPPLREARPRA